MGEFLRSRRARLRPDEVGLIEHGTRRRVPGLRREELALLAGVSVDHYIRLEQGRTLHFSESVLDAVSRALRLSDVERDHLYRLARPRADNEPAEQRVRPGLRLLVDSAEVPTVVLGRGTQVLAWNPLAAALFTDFGALPAEHRNLARLIFLDEGMRALYEDWPAKLADVTGYLRLEATRHPNDRDITTLIAELHTASEEFRARWQQHGLKEKTHGRYAYLHPLVGRIELNFETLRLPGDPDQAVIAHTVDPGSPSATALQLLANLAAKSTARA